MSPSNPSANLRLQADHPYLTWKSGRSIPAPSTRFVLMRIRLRSWSGLVRVALLGPLLLVNASFWGRTQAQGNAAQQASTTASSAAPNSSEKPAETVKPIQALGWLVGGVWTADATKMGPGMLRIETRYQWSDNNAYIRFTTHFVSDKGAAHTYDGNFFWNPADKTLAVWYMDAHNEITQGPVQVEGNETKIRFRGEDFQGQMADLRVVVHRKNNDDYHWALQEMQNGEWQDLAGLEYIRVAGS